MRYLRLTKVFFFIALLSGLIFSSSFLIMSPAMHISLNEGRNGLLYFSGALFWAGLLLTVVAWCLAAKMRKNYYFVNKQKKLKGRRPGLLRFFSNPVAVLADICAAISLIGFILCLIFASKSGLINYIFLFLTVLTVQLHAAFNGILFRFITNSRHRGNKNNEN